jgi:phenylalanine-4-hydroxylase
MAKYFNSDFSIEQNWQDYSEEKHAIWRLLFERQQRLLIGRACPEFLDGLAALGVAAEGIPDFRRLSEVLDAATGWRIVAVPGLVPDDVFFAHLARRRFPSTCFIRRRDQLDYLQEPDIFHDICGHVPLLMNPVFADYMQAYGEGGLLSAAFRCDPTRFRADLPRNCGPAGHRAGCVDRFGLQIQARFVA